MIKTKKTKIVDGVPTTVIEDEYEVSDFIVFNRDLIRAGHPEDSLPQLTNCQWCGNEELTRGLMMPGGNILWRAESHGEGKKPTPAPDRCTCEKSKAYWTVYDKHGKQTRQMLDKERREKSKQAWLERLVDRSEIERSFPGLTFDNYDPGDLSNRQNLTEIQQAYLKCKWYADTYKKEIAPEEGKYHGMGLFLSGGVGTGKTHLAVATLRALTDKAEVKEEEQTDYEKQLGIQPKLVADAITTLAIRSSELLNRIRGTYSDKDHQAEQLLMAMLTQVDVLLIDDLGKSKPTDWSLEQLFNIIDKRISTKKPIIVTVNYDDADLIDRLTPRYGNERGDSKTAEAIVSRLRQMCSRTPCGKIDYRQR